MGVTISLTKQPKQQQFSRGSHPLWDGNRPLTPTRACVKSADMKFGNDQIFDMENFDESSRWMGWSQNEFLHSLTTGLAHWSQQPSFFLKH
jgi:hypothetical protein